MPAPANDGLAAAVRAAIAAETQRIVEEGARAAAERVERRVRERTAAIAATVVDKFTLRMDGEKLIIEVSFPMGEETTETRSR